MCWVLSFVSSGDFCFDGFWAKGNVGEEGDWG